MRNLTAGQTPPAVRAAYREMTYESVIKTGGWYYSTFAEWAEVARVAIDSMNAELDTAARNGIDSRLLAQEREFVSSLGVSWRNKGIGTLVQTTDINVSNSAQAEGLRPYLRRIADEVCDKIRREKGSLSVVAQSAGMPLNTQKGAPFWIGSTNQSAANALASLCEHSNNLKELRAIAMAAPSAKLGLPITLYLRIQGARKPTEAMAWRNGEIVSAGEDWLPKRRKVQAVPWILNYYANKFTDVLRAVIVKWFPYMSGDYDYAAAVCSKSAYYFAADLKQYDLTVSGETNDVYSEEFTAPVADCMAKCGILTPREARLMTEYSFTVNNLPMLGPPGTDESASRLVDAFGQLRSGRKDTSLQGTIMNQARGRRKMKMHGLTGVFINQGDDTVVALSKMNEKGVDGYITDSNDLGFVEELATDNAFLMRRLPTSDDRGGYRYVGRMVLGTLNKEVSHEPNSLAVAAGGIAVRRDLVRGHPFGEAYYRTIQACANVRSAYARQRLSAAALISNGDYLRLIQLAAAETHAGHERKTLEMLSDLEILVSEMRTRTPELDAALRALQERVGHAFAPAAELEAAGKSMSVKAAYQLLNGWTRKENP